MLYTYTIEPFNQPSFSHTVDGTNPASLRVYPSNHTFLYPLIDVEFFPSTVSPKQNALEPRLEVAWMASNIFNWETKWVLKVLKGCLRMLVVHLGRRRKRKKRVRRIQTPLTLQKPNRRFWGNDNCLFFFNLSPYPYAPLHCVLQVVPETPLERAQALLQKVLKEANSCRILDSNVWTLLSKTRGFNVGSWILNGSLTSLLPLFHLWICGVYQGITRLSCGLSLWVQTWSSSSRHARWSLVFAPRRFSKESRKSATRTSTT